MLGVMVLASTLMWCSRTQTPHSYFIVTNTPCRWWIEHWTPNEQQELTDQVFSLCTANYLSVVPLFILFFSASLCFTVILPCPRIFPLYNIKKENRQLLNFHVITQFHKMHASTSLIPLHAREILQCHFFPLVVLINCTFSHHRKLQALFSFSTSIYQFTEEKMHVSLFTSALPYLPTLLSPPPPFLSSIVFALFCSALQHTGRCFGCSRLDCYTDQQRASACFLLFDMSSTPPQTNVQYTHTQTYSQMCIKGRHSQYFVVGLSRPRKDWIK